MKHESLMKLLESLYVIKARVHDVAETSVNEKLDEAIELVQQYLKDGSVSSSANDEILISVGKVLDRLPSIVALIKLFLD